MSRINFLAAVFLLGLVPGVSTASAPTKGEILTIEHLLGFDVVIDGVAGRSFASNPRFMQRDAETRTCILAVAQPLYAHEFHRRVAIMFESSEHIAAWQQFAGTRAGAAFVGHFRADLLADTKLGDKPAALALGAAEQAQVRAFLESPAGSMIRKGFPAGPLSPSADAALREDVRLRCGLSPKTSATP